jgi:hypothetical protein
MSKKRRKKKRRNVRQTIVSSLLDNTRDYFPSAAEDDRKGDLRSLKYSILHIAASVELLLKARLFQEHWYLFLPM